MTSLNMRALQTVTVGAGGAASISFTSIPQTYTDLFIYVSARTDRSSAIDNLNIQYNGNYSNVQSRELYGTGSAVGSGSDPSGQYTGYINGNNATANSFGVTYLYIPNYTLSINKSSNSDGTSENNATTAYQAMNANLWSNTAAITSITLAPYLGNTLLQYSTATLYGVSSAATGAKATGGIIYQDTNYFYHVFTSTGVFAPTQSITADCLVIAGGGGSGGSDINDKGSGGGGAGGLQAFTNQSLSAQNYTVTVGGGGTAGTHSGGATAGGDGNNSQFGSLTSSTGGGGGGAGRAGNGSGTNAPWAGRNGGSGGGSVRGGSAGTGTSGQGSNGGAAGVSADSGAGGGGATAVGADVTTNPGGAGGAGSSAYSSWGLATSTGQNVSGTYWYAGGGGGGTYSGGATSGGNGGGGAGGAATAQGSSGTANTGGGAGGTGGNVSAHSGNNGGSGIVIVRYAR